jgi:hypothetical protein
MIYAAEIENNTKSEAPRINRGKSEIALLYLIHKDDETIFSTENTSE